MRLEIAPAPPPEIKILMAEITIPSLYPHRVSNLPLHLTVEEMLEQLGPIGRSALVYSLTIKYPEEFVDHMNRLAKFVDQELGVGS